MKLNQLLVDFNPTITEDCEIQHITLDSREVKPGSLFVALKGTHLDGHRFIEEAITKGAAAVVCEESTRHNSIPVITVPQLKQKLSDIASRFYNYPVRGMEIIGVTGTNGKTSCTHFIAETLTALKKPCGVIGTLGYGLPDQLRSHRYTTPDPIAFQAEFAQLKSLQLNHVAMEVSSHGLAQDRLRDVPIKIAVLTNLTRDHLDFHGTMEAYKAAKRRLFTDFPSVQAAVINLDDAFGAELMATLPHQYKMIGYSQNAVSHAVPTLYAHPVRFSDHGTKMQMISPWGEAEFMSPLLGRFNVSNVLATLATLMAYGVGWQQALDALKHIVAPSGRMQRFGGGDKPLVVVDYAHTPDALEQALMTLREHVRGRLVCVFGCGGDRDRGKRPLMGRIAERLCDHFIITDDNPRFEDPAQITADIVAGLKRPDKAEMIHDREKAIQEAIAKAKSGDIVLIAGKGHEDYQIIGDQHIHASDIEFVNYFLTKKGLYG